MELREDLCAYWVRYPASAITHHTAERKTSGRRNGRGPPVVELWTPALDDSQRPVLGWFHGGAFVAGAGSYTTAQCWLAVATW